jgi:hypothetical protein
MIFVGLLKLRPVNRSPASITSSVVESCQGAIGSFKSNRVYNVVQYKGSLVKYQNSGIDMNQKSFSSMEDYMAWLDTALEEQGVSLGEYFAKQSAIKGYYERVILGSTRPDKISRFLLGGALENFFIKSIKIKNFDDSQSKLLKFIMTEKLAKEAMEKIYDHPPGKVSLFFKYGFEVLAYAPVLTGLPPLKIPRFRSMDEKRLLGAKNLEELKEIFEELSSDEVSLLGLKKKYDAFRKYYALTISGFYLYLTVDQIIDIDREEEMLIDINKTLDETIVELKELSNPSCESVYQCLEEYRSEWEKQGDAVYNEYKEICKEVYEVPEDC